MASLTVRDIPDALFDRIRILSSRDRRSINKEFLVILEDGLKANAAATDNRRGGSISPGLQLTIWRGLAGRWEDDRSVDETIADIRDHRTVGREVRL